MIVRAAKRAGISPALLAAVVEAESQGNPKARSSAGALGLTQLMPGTAKELGVKDPFNPAQNLAGGASYLKSQLQRFGSERLALAAYNAGPGNVQKAGNRVPQIPETQAYVQKVLELEESYKASGLSNITASDTTGTPVPAGFDVDQSPFPPETTMNLLIELLQPSEIAKSVMSKAGPTSEKVAASSDHSILISMLQAQITNAAAAQAPEVPTTASDVTAEDPTQGTANASLAGFAQPAQGAIIGTPEGHAARAMGNWESDNAVDISLKEGTPLVAMADGVIGSKFGSLNSSNPLLQGLRLHLVTGNNEFYYAHLSSFAPGIQPGVRVKKGQVIGYSGSANGAAHLHLGAKHGDPTSLYKNM